MSYGLYEVHEGIGKVTQKIMRIMTFSGEAAIRSFCHLQEYGEPYMFENRNGSVYTMSSQGTDITATCIRRYP